MDLGTPSHLLAFDSVRGTLGKAKGEQENGVLVLHLQKSRPEPTAARLEAEQSSRSG